MTTIATLFKRFALWKAQEGATVAELEQYQASISLPGTLKMIVLLRAFSWTSVGLVLLWSWFYLGSQAVSREYAKADSRRFNHTTLIFPNPEAPSVFQGSKEPSNMQVTVVNSAFMAVMQVNSQLAAQQAQQAQQQAEEDSSDASTTSSLAADTYGSALIPLMETESNTTASSNSLLGPEVHDGWREVRPYGSGSFTAGSGIPVMLPVQYNFSRDGSITQDYDYSVRFIGDYTMSASYIFPNCSDVIFSDAAALPSNATPAFTTFFQPTDHKVGDFPTVDVWTRDTLTNKTVRGRCTIARHYVDIQGNCDKFRCNTNQIRNAPNKAPSADTPFQDPTFSQRFFGQLLTAAGTPETAQLMSPVLSSGLNYTNQVLDTNTLNFTEGEWRWAPTYLYSDSSLQLTLSQTMSYLINTYLCASQPAGGLLAPADELNRMTFESQNALLTGAVKNGSWALTSKALGAAYEPTWVLVIPWIILDFMTCTILLLGAIASVWLRIRTVCPDVFGYVSSMTRDNPHIPVPKGGSTMSGTERARAMKNVRVKIGEVERGYGSPGHIGLALEHPEIPLDRLRRKGEYM